MPYTTLNWAWQVRGLTSTQKFLLVALADMADENHSCFPGQATLAEMTSSGRRSVVANLSRLEELGYFVRERRSRENGSRTSDRFLLQIDHQHDLSADSAHASVGLSAPDARASDDGLSASDGRDNMHEVHGYRNPQRNPQKEPPVVAPQQKRGTRIPQPFRVNSTMVAWAKEHAPLVDGARSTERFENYWLSVPGAKGVKLDWVRTWRNWLLKDQEDAERRPGSKLSPTERARQTLALADEQLAVSA